MKYDINYFERKADWADNESLSRYKDEIEYWFVIDSELSLGDVCNAMVNTNGIELSKWIIDKKVQVTPNFFGLPSLQHGWMVVRINEYYVLKPYENYEAN